MLVIAGLDLGFIAGLGEAFVRAVFLGVGPSETLWVASRAGFGIGFGVIFAFGAGVAMVFAGVAVAVALGVAVGNSISLFALVTGGFSSAVSSFSFWLGSVSAVRCFADGDSSFSDRSAERSPAPPNHTMLSGFDGVFAATLQRISPAISAMCASAIRMTFRQKGFTRLSC